MQWLVNTGKDDNDKSKKIQENATVEIALQIYEKKQITQGSNFLCQQNPDTEGEKIWHQ